MRSSHHRRRRAGFTLLELMITLMIISILAVIASPSISAVMADRRTSEAALDIVRLHRRARAEALGFGRAYVVTYTQSGMNGIFRTYRGTTQSCNNNDWTTLITGTCVAGSACVEELDTSSDRFVVGAYSVMVAPSIGASYEICFQPNGATLLRTTGAGTRFVEQWTGSQPRYMVTTRKSGATQGVSRTVVVPYGAEARMRR